MQLMFQNSEEGTELGMGWLDGDVVSIDSNRVRVPHIGWNNVTFKNKLSSCRYLNDNTDFYFDHKYYTNCPKNIIIGTVDYGQTLVAAVRKDNIMGVQFHPEKSHKSGLKLLLGFFEEQGIKRDIL